MTTPINRPLYRFMSFQSFSDMIQRNALCFVKPELWEDPYEAFFFKKFHTPVGKVEIMKLTSGFENSDFCLFIIEQFERTFYAQSWTSCEESDALWKIYSFGNFGIRIKVLESNIKGLDEVDIMDVDYVKKHDLDEEIRRIGIKNGQTMCREIYRLKRMAFQHEEEVRLVYQLKEGVNTKETPTVHYVDYSSNREFFESVCLHPLAPSWFNETMKRLCELNGINYVGQSKLYEKIN